jgi:cell wall-associated NlpC family hydrolase
MSDIQAGDMLYFGQSRVTHVGIYIGNGQMIHAPKPGDHVKISSISWHVNTYKIQGGRRFVK